MVIMKKLLEEREYINMRVYVLNLSVFWVVLLLFVGINLLVGVLLLVLILLVVGCSMKLVCSL